MVIQTTFNRIKDNYCLIHCNSDQCHLCFQTLYLAALSCLSVVGTLCLLWGTELAPWSGILPANLTGPKLLKKFSAFYETRRLIAAYITACHLALSWARSIQSVPPSHFFKINFNVILPSGFLTNTLHAPLRVTCPADLSLLDLTSRMLSGEDYTA